MEDAYIINGGKKLEGKVNLSGAKNAALKMIIASLLFEEKVILENVPRIRDVEELLHLINKLGVSFKYLGKNTLEIDPQGLKNNKVDFFHASKIRVSFMLFAPLLYKFGECFIPNPGGCRIGARPIDRIVEGMKTLGIKVVYDSQTGFYQAKMDKKPTGYFRFNKPTHTGTELLIMLSVFGKEKVIIDNCANEPEIDNLIDFLNQGGAKIKKTKGRVEVEGVKRLSFKKPFEIILDRNEAVTYTSLVIATKGKIKISIKKNYLETFIKNLINAGVIFKEEKESLFFSYSGRLLPTSIETSPHPGFMTDWQPNWAVLMTQAQGKSIIHERVFENRFSYVEELKKLGAQINFIEKKVINPKDFYYFNYDEKKKYQQIIEIIGPNNLHNGVLNIADLRAGASLAMAALIAKGESVVNGVSILERGYEDFVEKVKLLGGDIKLI